MYDDYRPERPWIAAIASIVVHVSVLAAVLYWGSTISRRPPHPVVRVGLTKDSTPAAPKAAAPAPPTPAPPKPRFALAATSPTPHVAPAPTLVAKPKLDPPPPSVVATQTVSVAATSSAQGARDSGSIGAVAAESLPAGACDMAARLQSKLRRDPLVRAAVARAKPAQEGAILVWNGEWIGAPGEDGMGMATVREAIVSAVAFSPAICREERVHGPVLFALGASAQPRIAIGTRDWRWGDLLMSR